MSEKSLLIFLASSRIDPYINVLVHACKREQVTDVQFVSVLPVSDGEHKRSFRDLEDRIWASLRELGKGLLEGKPLSDQERVASSYQELDRALVSRSHKFLLYADLPKVVKSYSATKSTDQLLVDVTGLPKKLASDVVAVGLSLGLRVCTFELADSMRGLRREDLLFHALSEEQYSYICLTETPVVRNASTRLVRRDRVLMWTLVMTSVTLASFSILLFVNDQNVFLKILGIAANVLGVLGPVYQLAIVRK